MQQLRPRDIDKDEEHREHEKLTVRFKREWTGTLEFELQPPEIMLPRLGRKVVAGLYAEQAEILERVARRLKVWLEELRRKDEEEGVDESEEEAVAMKRDEGESGGGAMEKEGDVVEASQNYTNAADATVEEDHGNTNHKKETPIVKNFTLPNSAPSDNNNNYNTTTTTMTTTSTNSPTSTTIGQATELSNDKELSSKSIAPASTATPWVPLGVRLMPPTPCPPDVGAGYQETFPLSFLSDFLNGELWSPGYFFVPHSRPTILPSRSYWLLDAALEPYIPHHPGQHGAKLTAFFNFTASAPGEAPEVANYVNTPVFVREVGKDEWRYFGQYSQLRFSDRLDFDRVHDVVPEEVRKWWARCLGDKRNRPVWVERELMRAFWPRPVYEGPVPGDEREDEEVWNGKVERALWAYAEELRDWERDARIKVSHLRAKNLEQAFLAADANEEPGLRLWWEYLQCVGFDEEFYGMLVRLKELKRMGQDVKAAAGLKRLIDKKDMSNAKVIASSTGTLGSDKNMAHMTGSVQGSTTESMQTNAMNTSHPTSLPLSSAGPTHPQPGKSMAKADSVGFRSSGKKPKNIKQAKAEGDDVKNETQVFPDKPMGGAGAFADDAAKTKDNHHHHHHLRKGSGSNAAAAGKGKGRNGVAIPPHLRK